MEYEDFPYQDVDKSFISQREVVLYMERFAEQFGLLRHIKVCMLLNKLVEQN